MSQNDKLFLEKPLILRNAGVEFEVSGGGGKGKLYMSTGGVLYYKSESGTAFPIAQNVHKNGTATRAGNTASGNQTIAHGCGGIPSKLRFSVNAKWTGDSTASSIGTYNGTTMSVSYVSRDVAAGNPVSGVSSSYVIYMYDSATGATLQTATVTVDATNITLAWVLTGAGHANNMNILWEADLY